MTDCREQQSAWEKCLAKSGRNPGKCGKTETELRKCGGTSSRVQERLCIDETISLMNCTRRNDAGLCSREFVNFRECRRPLGRQLMQSSPDGGWTVVEAAKSQYIDEGQVLRRSIEQSEVFSTSSASSLKHAAEEYAKSLGLVSTSDLRF